MVRHHPDDEVLLSVAAGRLPAGATVIVSVHLEYCSQCRTRVRALESVGGAFLDMAEPHPLTPNALGATLERINIAPEASRGAAAASRAMPETTVPLRDVPPLKSLRTCKLSRWYWIGPGRRVSRVQPAHEPKSSLFLLRIAPERSLPRHSHTGLEFTQVLTGSFHNGQSVLRPGDFDAATREAHHQPIARPGSVCVCLVWLEGRLRFDGWALRPVGRWIGS